MKSIKGFTLIELLVVISIVMLMTIVIFSNYGKNNEMFALERSAQKLAQDVRRTQEMAISGAMGGSQTYGYGLYFNKTSEANKLKYSIYEEKDADGINVVMTFQGIDTYVEQTINIEKGIKICDFADNGSSASNALSVSFEPPKPITYINGVSSGHEATITLCIISDTSKTRTVTINNTGMVQITK